MPAWRGNRLVVLRQNPSPQGPGGWPIGILYLAHRAEIRITGRRGPCLCSRQGGSSGVLRDASYALPAFLLYRDCFTLCPGLWQRPIASYALIRVLRAYSRFTRGDLDSRSTIGVLFPLHVALFLISCLTSFRVALCPRTLLAAGRRTAALAMTPPNAAPSNALFLHQPACPAWRS